MIDYLFVAIGAVVGATSRFWITHILDGYYSLLFVNIFGSFVIGLSLPLSLKYHWISTFLVIGLLGSFTTFSSFSLKTVELLKAKSYGPLLIFTSSQLLFGIAFAALGIFLAERVFIRS